MNNVIYRDLNRNDYEDIKLLIDEAFKFSDFIKDSNFLDSLLDSYLQSCILDSSFAKVAESNGELLGFILGDASSDSKKIRKFHNVLSSIFSIPKLFFTSYENRKSVKAFLDMNQTYKELMKGKKNDFEACIHLFIVSEKQRGLGVGKNLLKHLFDYMKSKDVESLYLYTDGRCNYGFYDSQGFNCISEKKIMFDISKSELDVFLYSYKFI